MSTEVWEVVGWVWWVGVADWSLERLLGSIWCGRRAEPTNEVDRMWRKGWLKILLGREGVWSLALKRFSPCPSHIGERHPQNEGISTPQLVSSKIDFYASIVALTIVATIFSFVERIGETGMIVSLGAREQ
ncbi:unnamed protein product [Dovyalis caffra]|uniref:Uncharacterized protein n=1 Tax=Dovyalis caffra TaxID=77055 RepID=A0AAV1ST00_9ROSI|nr:unnamed protein product [Dovyalis caffra]